MNRRLLVVAGVVTLAAADVAFAKCGWANYQLNALVLDKTTQAHLAGASLVFFADDSSEAWLVDGTDTRPERYITDAAGRLSASFHLDTYSGWFPFDRCHHRLKRLTIVATRSGYVGKRFTFKAAKLFSRLNGNDTTVVIPALELEHEP